LADLRSWQILAATITATITAAKLCQATKARMARSTASRQFSHQTMPRVLVCAVVPRSIRCCASKAGGSGARRRKSPGWSPNCSSRSWSTSSWHGIWDGSHFADRDPYPYYSISVLVDSRWCNGKL
jgi:hypothetical protein